MASKELQEIWKGYQSYYKANGADATLIDAACKASAHAVLMDGDLEYAFGITSKSKEWINELITTQTGGDFDALEVWSQEKKKPVELLNQYYGILLLEAPYLFESFCLYIEKDRLKRERFYEPRMNPLSRVAKKMQALEDDKLDELFIHMPARVGKLIADDVPVFTSEGWKKHGDLTVGDKVIGSDGGYTEVLEVHPKNVADYKVTLSNGEEILCHGNHEWTVFDRNCQRWHTYETHSMVGRERRNGDAGWSLYLPIREPMKGVKREFKLHPYVLGAWLGDGTNRKPWITDPASDVEIAFKIVECGYPLRKIYTHKTTGVKSYVFDSQLVTDLREYDMCFYTKTCEKHIPVEYLTADIEQRLELLAGLLDTDGTLVRKERRYQFSTVSKRLADDVETLIHTFGWRVSRTVYAPHTSSSGIEGKKECYCLGFNPDIEIPCVIERKHLREFSRKKRISIQSIEKIDSVQGNCITVANEDGLYAVGRTMQLTHNSQLSTLFMAWHCSRNTEASNLYVTYKEGLGGAFLEGVQELITDPTYCFADVFPKVKIIDTDAKNNKMDLGTDKRRKKKYKSLSGKGLESGLNGEYDAYGIMLLDDILEGVQDVMSSEVLKRKQTIFDNNVMSRPKESCKIIYNGTIWATNDLFMNRLQFLEENPTAKNIRYEVIKIPALDENDESNFDYKYGVGYSTDYYKARRAKFEMNNDMAGWFAQCQQEPIDRTNAVFTPETMQYYDFLPEGEPIKVIAHCDVALGGGDFLSFPVAYYYENPDGSLTGYIEDVVFDNSEKHITQPQVVNMIAKHHIKQVHFESNQGGEGYKDDIKRLLKESGYKEVCNITSSWAPVTKRKDQRIWDCAQEIREFMFKDVAHRNEQYRKFMQNIFSFTMNMSRKAHDDSVDSLAGLVEFEKSGSGVLKAFIMRSPI